MNKLVKYKFIVKTITVDALIRPGVGGGWGEGLNLFSLRWLSLAHAKPCYIFALYSAISQEKRY